MKQTFPLWMHVFSERALNLIKDMLTKQICIDRRIISGDSWIFFLAHGLDLLVWDSYLLRVEIRPAAQCLWQLNLTGGNRYNGKGLWSQNFLHICFFFSPGQASLCILIVYLHRSPTFHRASSNFPSACQSSLLNAEELMSIFILKNKTTQLIFHNVYTSW